MPMMSAVADSNTRLLRMFLYGRGKTKKTTWACRAAELGYNVLHIDGDDGGHILWQDGIIKKPAWSRVTTINVVDTLTRAVFAAFTAQFCRNGNSFLWDEQEKQVAYGSVCVPEHSHVMLNPALFTPNDVVILDSWTTLVSSTLFQFAKEQNIDLSEADKVDWGGYGFQGRFLDFVLKTFKAFNCHIIVIGHATVYEKYSKKDAEGKSKMLSQTTQPISCSGPHATKLDGSFSDVLYFEKASDTAYYIDTGGSSERVGGSRHFDGKKYRFADLPISMFFEKANSTPAVDQKPTGWTYYGPGEKPVLGGPSKVSAVTLKSSALVTPQANAEIKIEGGLLARLAKKAAG